MNIAAPIPIDDLLRIAAGKLERVLGEADRSAVLDYIAVGEPGVGWELLAHIVREAGLAAPPELIESGRRMGFDRSAAELAGGGR